MAADSIGYRVTHVLGVFSGDRDAPHRRTLRERTLLRHLWCMVEDNLDILEHADPGEILHPYKCGTWYQAEPDGQEDWLDILCVNDEARKGRGADCEDLAAYLAAWYIFHGIAAYPVFVWRYLPDGGTLYHIVVQLPDGSIEDPSKHLGMG
jgi:hypothetical protein